jgi:hypothetical protein
MESPPADVEAQPRPETASGGRHFIELNTSALNLSLQAIDDRLLKVPVVLCMSPPSARFSRTLSCATS